MKAAGSLCLGLCVAMAGGLSGCTEQGPDVSIVIYDETPEAGMDSGISGTLQVTEGCVTIDDTLVVWPAGTKVLDEDPLRLDVPGFGEARAGSTMSGSGGLINDRDAAELTIPERCQGLVDTLWQFLPTTTGS